MIDQLSLLTHSGPAVFSNASKQRYIALVIVAGLECVILWFQVGMYLLVTAFRTLWPITQSELMVKWMRIPRMRRVHCTDRLLILWYMCIPHCVHEEWYHSDVIVSNVKKVKRKKEFLHYPFFRIETLAKLFYRSKFKKGRIVLIIHLLEFLALQHLEKGGGCRNRNQ